MELQWSEWRERAQDLVLTLHENRGRDTNQLRDMYDSLKRDGRWADMS